MENKTKICQNLLCLYTFEVKIKTTSSPGGVLGCFALGIRTLHTTANLGHSNSDVTPVVIYINADSQKELIVNDNRKKAGVYRWVNKENGKTYVGSAVNLSRRLREYFDFNRISKGNMSINKALLKYGYSGFQLEILEYCEPSDVILREQFYIDRTRV